MPCDIAKDKTVSLVTAECWGTKLRAVVVNNAGVVGGTVESERKRYRSSGISWMLLEVPGEIKSTLSTAETKPRRWPISWAATVSKSIVLGVMPSERSKSKEKLELKVMAPSLGPNPPDDGGRSSPVKPSALRLALVTETLPSKPKPGGSNPANCARVGSEAAILSLSRADAAASATIALRIEV